MAKINGLRTFNLIFNIQYPYFIQISHRIFVIGSYMIHIWQNRGRQIMLYTYIWWSEDIRISIHATAKHIMFANHMFNNCANFCILFYVKRYCAMVRHVCPTVSWYHMFMPRRDTTTVGLIFSALSTKTAHKSFVWSSHHRRCYIFRKIKSDYIGPTALIFCI